LAKGNRRRRPSVGRRGVVGRRAGPPGCRLDGWPGRPEAEGTAAVTKRQADEVPARRILVVNDTQEILDLLREIFEEEGYEVSTYSFAFQDLEQIKAEAPDLIVLDFIIGGEQHGWQLLQKLKLDRQTADIPVIVCTAALQLARELEGHLLEKGVGVVLKPFDIDDLLRQVQTSWDRLNDNAHDTGRETGDD
jgi:CheY-like chemotaxis protein